MRPGGPAPGAPSAGGRPPAGGHRPAAAIAVRRARQSDVTAVAALHAAGISEGFLSLLGVGFLRRLYGRAIRHSGSFLFVADDESRVVGFVAGSTDLAGLYRSFVLHDGLVAALGALGPLVRGRRKVFETLRYGSPEGRGATGGAELLSIAVDPSCRGRGAGRLLVASFLDETQSRGCTSAHVVVGAENRAAISLYEGAGFLAEDRFELHPGTESLFMKWEATDGRRSSGTGR